MSCFIVAAGWGGGGPATWSWYPVARPHRTLKRKVPYRQHPSLTQSADARAAWVPPMWPPTVSGPQWGGCSLLCSSWTHAEPLHKAGKKDKREHWLITAAKPNKQIMTSTQSEWSKIWSYIKKAMVDQGNASCFTKLAHQRLSVAAGFLSAISLESSHNYRIKKKVWCMLHTVY